MLPRRTKNGIFLVIGLGLLFACRGSVSAQTIPTDSASCSAAGGSCATKSLGCDVGKVASGHCDTPPLSSTAPDCCFLPPSLGTTPAAPAAPATPPTPKSLNEVDPLQGADIPTVIGRIISVFLGIVGSIALLAFVYAGFVYMTATGDAKRIQKAKDIMKYSFMGLAIILFAYIIATNYLTILGG